MYKFLLILLNVWKHCIRGKKNLSVFMKCSTVQVCIIIMWSYLGKYHCDACLVLRTKHFPICLHYFPQESERGKESMKRRGRSQVARERKKRSEQWATTVLRVESSYRARRAHQSQKEAKDASAR